jgi:hypothetical protein
MEHTLWELFVFLVMTPIALAIGAMVGIDRCFRLVDGHRDPRTLGQIVNLSQAECTGTCIGHWGDIPIFDYLVLRGRTFCYDRLVRPDYQLRVRPDEVYVVPGLVYRAGP